MRSTTTMRWCPRRPRISREFEGGFTLVELLVVIVILGILSAVVVFAVRGVGDKGRTEAIATEERILRTAEESYCAQWGQYATQTELKTGGYLTGDPGYMSVDKTTAGPCGGTGYVISGVAQQTSCSPRKWCTNDKPPGFGRLLELSSGKVFLMGVTDNAWAIGLYDPTLPEGHRWQNMDSLPGAPGFGYKFVELGNGKILVRLYSELPQQTGYIWWIFDPTQAPGSQWQGFGPSGADPQAQPAYSGLAKLQDGRVLAIRADSQRGSADLYDPRDGSFTNVVPNLSMGTMGGPLLVTLADGRVLAVSNDASTPNNTPVAKLFNPANATFTSATPPANVYDGGDASAVLLPTGKVLVVGPASTEIYDPGSDKWSTATSCQTGLPWPSNPENCHMLALLPSGRVLAYTGTFGRGSTGDKKTWLFDPARPTDPWTSTGDLNSATSAGWGAFIGGTCPSCGRVMTVGLDSAELYTP